jgi:hypothetical protein
MGLHGTVFIPILHSYNEIRVYGPNPGCMVVAKYKVKFDEHVSYLPALRESD